MNKEIKTLIIVFIFAVILMFLSYFQSAPFSHFPITGISTLLMAIMSGVVGIRLIMNKERTENITNFAFFFLLFALFMFFMFIPKVFLFFPHGEDHTLFNELMHWGYVIGHAFLYISLAVFIRIPLSFTYKKWKNIGSIFFLFLGTVTTIINIIYPNQTSFDHSTGVTILGVNSLVGGLVGVNVLLAWVPAGIYFLYHAYKKTNPIVRRKSLLLGLGLIITTIGGPLHDISYEPLILFIADIVVLLGIAVLASGVFYDIKNTQNLGDIE